MCVTTYTIGFTKKKASRFFELLSAEHITTLIDVRLNNASQLSGFAKRDDLQFFLKELCGIEYRHHVELAPTKKLLQSYKNGDTAWEAYEGQFFELMCQRNVENMINPDELENSCLLCSENQPHHCHRRLVVEYLNQHWETNIAVKHLF